MSPMPNYALNEEQEIKQLSELATTPNKIDWKPAIILSEIYLEKTAKNRLKKILKNRKINLDKKIENLTLKEITLFLYSLHEINSKQFTEINKIRKQKNRIIHPKQSNISTYSGDEANQKFQGLIGNALKIITYLKDY